MGCVRRLFFGGMLLASLSGLALTETVNGVSWYYTVTSGNATLTGCSSPFGSMSIPSKLGGYNVREVGTEAFRKCSGLTSVTIPDSVTHINTNAFRECYYLTNVTIGNSVETIDNAAFKDCSSLTNVILPDSLTLIHNYVFAGCVWLTDIKIPDNVARIRPHAFEGCTRLKSIELGRSVNNIGDQCFYNCTSLRSMTFDGDAPGRLGTSVFGNVASDCCVYINRGSTGWGVTIPGTWMGLAINYIHHIVRFNANGGICTPTSVNVEHGKALGTAVELPVPTPTVGMSALASFLGWFTAVKGGAEVTAETVITADTTIYAHWDSDWRYRVSDGKATITGCSMANGDLSIPIEVDGYQVVGLATYVFQNCTNLTSVVIPECVTNIGERAFYGCNNLTNVTIPSGVTNMGVDSLYGTPFYDNQPDGLVIFGHVVYKMKGECPSIVTIPSGVTSICGKAFYGCTNLTNVTITDSVKSIGGYAFKYCPGLTNIIFAGDAPTVGTGVFSDVGEGCKGTISRSASGWGTPISRTWNGLLITYPWYLVEFDVTGGTCQEESRTVDYGLVVGDLPTPVRSGYSFDGWYSANNGGVEIHADDTVVSDMQLYAHWIPYKYLVTFDANGGTGGKSGKQDYGTAIVAPTVTRTGYTFKGWSPNVAATVPANDVTYTAQWEVNRYTATFNANGGTGGGSVTADYGAAITAPAVTRENYTFVGWTPAFSGTMPAADTTYKARWQCDWRLSTNANTTVTIVGVNFTPDGDLTIPVAIEGRSVTGIGAEAFSGCAALTSIMIPDGVANIGDGAFWGCCGMADSNGLVIVRGRLHYCCGEVKSVSIPSDVTSIGMSAFSDCGGLTSVTIPNSVTNIGVSAFTNCANLTSVHIDDLAAWCSVSFADPFANPLRYAGNLYVNEELVNDLAITDGVKDVAPFAFYGCCGITSLTIPDSVTRIGTNAFYGCTGLTSATFGNGVTNVGRVAFGACSNLACVTVGRYFCEKSTFSSRLGAFPLYTSITNVVILDGVTNIGASAFSGLRGLREVTIPDSVTGIGTSAFYNCTNLTNIAIPGNVTSIGNQAFYGCCGLASMTIPDGVTNIGDYAFYKCTGLTEIILPNSVTNIGSYAFRDCTGLTCVAISTNLTRMGACAFYTCTNLTSVTIPASVTSIGESAFGVCSNLAIVIFDGNAPTVGRSVFDKVASGCQAYVHRASTGWNVTIPGTWNGLAIDYMRHDVMFDTCGGEYELTVTNVIDGASVGEFPWPTRSNAAFLGWFTAAEGGDRVDETTAITGSVTLYAHWLLAVEAPVVEANEGNPFRTDACEVSITCATDGATIYYADDGTTPKIREEYLYTGPFTITDTATIKAVAVYGGIKSRYETVTIKKKPLTMEEVLDVGEGVVVETSASFPWRPILDSNAKVGDATARSGEIGNRTNTWLTATVSGAGTMSFWCKVSCEHDDEDLFACDRLMVYTNGVEITDWRMDGETGWTQRELTFAGGDNTVKWVYYKDKSDTAGEDCAWVDGISWTPSGAADGLAAWLAERNLAADALAANGRTAAECYALGLDPALATNDFRIVSIEIVDGKPRVEWEPKTNRWTGVEIQAVLKGAERLEGPWAEVPAGGNPAYRFFKVVVVP